MHVNAPLSAGLTFAATGQDLFLDLLPWLIALVVLVVIGGMAIFAAKRLLRGGEDSAAGGFTLQSLRDMHAAGELSDEEFAKARAAMIGQVRKDAMAETTPRSDGAEADGNSTPMADNNARETGTEQSGNGPISS